MLTPLSLRCGALLPHRATLAPLTNVQSNTDGSLRDDELNWLVARAPHFALLSTCAAFVSEEGHAWDGQLGVASEAHEPGLKRLAAALGAVSIVQLHHGGLKADLAPQRISADTHEGVRAATAADLDRVVSDFVEAAARSIEAGFSGVEVHGANGYLFDQFLAPADNHRTDAYGGSLENRARLLLQTTRAVRERIGPDRVLSVRMSPVDTWQPRGLEVANSARVAGWLGEAGADIVHLSLRDASGPPPEGGSEVPVVTTIRDAVDPEVAVQAAGGVWTLRDAERARKSGADLVTVGRAGIIHPDWPARIQDPGFEPTRPPWGPDSLYAVDVSERFVTYLRHFKLVAD